MVKGTSNIDSNNGISSSEEEEGSVGDYDYDYDDDDYDYDDETTTTNDGIRPSWDHDIAGLGYMTTSRQGRQSPGLF